MKSKKILLTALAVLLIAGMSVIPASAYFTASAGTEGSIAVNVDTSTDIREDPPTEWTKSVQVYAGQDSEPVYVRARAFCLTYDFEYIDDSGLWGDEPEDDGWLYYDQPLQAGAYTEPLQILINGGETPEGEAGDNFDVIVVYESTPLQYDANGNMYADWTLMLNSGNEGGN